MDALGPISWILLGGAVWIACTLLLSVLWYRASRAQPRIVHEPEKEKKA